MNNISDKLVLTIILITILFVFGLIFSVKSPERKVIDSPIMWRDDYSNIAIFKSNNINSERIGICLLYTSPSPRDATLSRMPSSA